MTFTITQTCCNDASCVSVCPVNCIHPAPGEPDFGNTDMLYIDPQACIDCGACADACPVDAIFPAESLTAQQQPYAEINAAYYTDTASAVTEPPTADTDQGPNFHAWDEPVFDRVIPADFAPLDVAVVGTGPAGMYAVEDLLLHTDSLVTLIDRLPIAGGLVRHGVAPDHASTKKIGETFARFHKHPRLRMRLGVEVGRDVTVNELASRHDAVIYAVGASAAHSLGIPGEDLPGSLAATDVVAWYNGHPDAFADAVDLAAERVIVVGNGNVALDVARILTMNPDALADTAISPAALASLRSSKVREVVVLGRRGPEDAAYTRPELLGITARQDVDVVVDNHDPRIGEAIDGAADGSKAALLRDARREAVDLSAPPPHERRRIVLRFHSAPREVAGDAQVRGLRVTGSSGGPGTARDACDTGDAEVAAGLVIRAVGYRGTPVDGLPFDERTGTIPHTSGRVAGRAGTYVVGWIKRGPSGGIGANRACAKETVGALLGDAIAGRLPQRRTRGERTGVAARIGRRVARRLRR